jgi:hypothetical protein
MMEVYGETNESREMQDVVKTITGIEVYEKALDTAARMEVCENALGTRKMVGESWKWKRFIHGLLQLLDWLNNLIKKVQVR